MTTTLREKISDMGRRLKEVEKLLLGYENVKKNNDINDFYKLRYYLEKLENVQTNGVQTETNENLLEFIENEKKFLLEIRQKFISNFWASLDSSLMERKLKLEGQFPEFHVKFFTIKADKDLKKVKLWYGTDEVLLHSLKEPIPRKLAALIFKELERITKIRFDSNKFLSLIRQAYDKSIKCIGISDGDLVSIPTILKEINVLNQEKSFWANPNKERFRVYTREEFSFDLSTLYSSSKSIDNKVLQLSIATRNQSKQAMDYIWIPECNSESFRGTVYSNLSFREVKE